MILVVGATGVLGGMVAHILLSQGKGVRILMRPDSPAEELSKQGMATNPQALIDTGAQMVMGNLRDRASLDTACMDVDTVITTATAASRDGDFNGIDLHGTMNLIEVAKSTGVSQFIYISAYGAVPDHPHPLYRAKGLCEEHIAASGMNYTILSPDVFIEIWGGAVVGIPLQAGQPITLVGDGVTMHAFISIADVVTYCAMAVDNPVAKNQKIPIGADRSYSWNEVVAEVGRVLGQDLPVNYVAPGNPIPLIPEEMGPMLAGLESTDRYIEMQETSRKYSIEPTTMATALERMFG